MLAGKMLLFSESGDNYTYLLNTKKNYKYSGIFPDMLELCVTMTIIKFIS